MNNAPPTVLTVTQAWQQLAERVAHSHLSVERISTLQASGRILAVSPTANVNAPPQDMSAMDGFAVRASDAPGGNTVKIVQRIAAGDTPQPLDVGCAARIFTGAAIPAGADSVVIQENTSFDEHEVTFNKTAHSGANIRRLGEDIKDNMPLLPAARRVRPQDIGLLLSGGVQTVEVHSRLRVGVIATGNELLDIDQPLTPGKIFESNSPMIAAQLTNMGFVPTRYRAVDTLSDTIAVMEQALRENDAVLTIGGVSVGEEDHVRAALQELGEIEFWKIALKPGKPFLFGSAQSCPVMGLPGNPVSSFVTFGLFCRPFLDALGGADYTPPRMWPATAGFSFERPADRQQFLRGQTSHDGEKLVVEPLTAQGSGMQSALSQADVLISIPIGEQVRIGQTVQVISLSDFVP